MDRTALKEREKIIELMSSEADNQPMASQRVIEALDVLYGDILLKEVLSVETGAHYEGNNVVNGIDVPHAPAVIAVAEASFESILHLVPPV